MSAINWFSSQRVRPICHYTPDVMSITPGECVAICGKTGSGKTHLALNLMYRLPSQATSQFTQMFYWSGATSASESIDDPIVSQCFPRVFPDAFRRIDLPDVECIRQELSAEQAELDREIATADPEALGPYQLRLRNAGLPLDRLPPRVLIIDDFAGRTASVRQDLFALPSFCRKYQMSIVFICHAIGQLPTQMRPHIKKWFVFAGMSGPQLGLLQRAGALPQCTIRDLITAYSRCIAGNKLDRFMRIADTAAYRGWSERPILSDNGERLPQPL